MVIINVIVFQIGLVNLPWFQVHGASSFSDVYSFLEFPFTSVLLFGEYLSILPLWQSM